MPELKLYYRPSCPFCQKVLRFLEQNHIQITLNDISQNEKYLKELIEIGGKKQVPCLFIDGHPMYESDDIIKWLGENGP